MPVQAFDQETLEKAQEKVYSEQIYASIKQVPKTAAGFSKYFTNIRGKQNDLYAYIKNIPTTAIEEIFKEVEI